MIAIWLVVWTWFVCVVYALLKERGDRYYIGREFPAYFGDETYMRTIVEYDGSIQEAGVWEQPPE